jgi:V8-like Glu-specific endopeptidase
MARSRRSGSETNAPLTPDQLLALDNAAASEPIPADIADALATRRLIISGVRDRIELGAGEAESGSRQRTFQIPLPATAIVGLPGKTATRMPKPSAKKSAGRAPRAHRPDWVDQVHHPKRGLAPPWSQGPVRRPGYQGEVFYGVFGSDDRAVYYPSGYPWQCVRKVFAWTDASAASPAWSGSAVLVGSRLVLTAGHVVPGTRQAG